MDNIITPRLIQGFEDELRREEREENTICKYIRDVYAFYSYAGANTEIDHKTAVDYKKYLQQKYSSSSINSMLSSVNKFFRYAGWNECQVKLLKIQNTAFRDERYSLTKNEYYRLLKAAENKKQTWLYMIMITLGSTGIRVSELRFITAESLKAGKVSIYNKGKIRQIILTKKLCEKLRKYIKSRGIVSGSIFITRNGKPIDRSNIHHAMKKLCRQAGVKQSKVFPHNLRHLFAVSYYEKCHDLMGLASFLGHSNINTTRIYTMTTVEQKERFVNDLRMII